MGTHGVGVMNGDGLQLVNICAENNLVTQVRYFQNKTIHKITWASPDQRTHNHIDSICIGKKLRRCVLDVHVKVGADAASVHYLVIWKPQLKIADNSARTKYNVDYPKERDHLDK